MLWLIGAVVCGAGWSAPPLVTADGEVLQAPTSTPLAAGPAPALAGVPPPMPAPVPAESLSVSRAPPPPVPAPRAGAPLFQPVALRVTSASSVDASASAPSSGQGPDDDAATSAAARADSAPTDAAVVREAPAEAAVGVSARAASPVRREHPLLGVQLDVGFPDGAGASLMVMPVDWLRLQVGGSWNGASRGVRFGLVVLLFPSFFQSVRPTVSVESGYAFDPDSKWLVSMVQDAALKAALERVTVLHGGGHLGLEFGSKYFSFFLRAGVSWVDVQLASYEGESLAVRGLALHGLFPSGKLGFLVCFL